MLPRLPQLTSFSCRDIGKPYTPETKLDFTPFLILPNLYKLTVFSCGDIWCPLNLPEVSNLYSFSCGSIMYPLSLANCLKLNSFSCGDIGSMKSALHFPDSQPFLTIPKLPYLSFFSCKNVHRTFELPEAPELVGLSCENIAITNGKIIFPQKLPNLQKIHFGYNDVSSPSIKESIDVSLKNLQGQAGLNDCITLLDRDLFPSSEKLELARKKNLKLDIKIQSTETVQKVIDFMQDPANNNLLTNLVAITFPTVVFWNIDKINRALDLLFNHCQNLTSFSCGYIYVPVTIPNFPNLTSFSCKCAFKEITIPNFEKLTSFSCYDISEALVIPNFKNLIHFSCERILAPAKFENLENLVSFSCTGIWKSLELLNLPNLKSFYCDRIGVDGEAAGGLLLAKLPKLTSLSFENIESKHTSVTFKEIQQPESLSFRYIHNSLVKLDLENLQSKIKDEKIREMGIVKTESELALKNKKIYSSIHLGYKNENELPEISKDEDVFHMFCNLILEGYPSSQDKIVGTLDEFLEVFSKKQGNEIIQALEKALLSIPETHLKAKMSIFEVPGGVVADNPAYLNTLSLLSKLVKRYCSLDLNFENSYVLSNLVKKLVVGCKESYKEPSRPYFGTNFNPISKIPSEIIDILLILATEKKPLTSAIPAEEIKAIKELLSHLLKKQYDQYPRSLYDNTQKLLTIIRGQKV